MKWGVAHPLLTSVLFWLLKHCNIAWIIISNIPKLYSFRLSICQLIEPRIHSRVKHSNLALEINSVAKRDTYVSFSTTILNKWQSFTKSFKNITMWLKRPWINMYQAVYPLLSKGLGMRLWGQLCGDKVEIWLCIHLSIPESYLHTSGKQGTI